MYVEPAMIMVKLNFFSFDTRAGKTICMDLLLFGARIYPDDVRG